jgi:hypothetical protein
MMENRGKLKMVLYFVETIKHHVIGNEMIQPPRTSNVNGADSYPIDSRDSRTIVWELNRPILKVDEPDQDFPFSIMKL